MTFQRTVSYAFNDRFSIGFGPTINRLSGILESDIILPLAGTEANHVKIKGNDTAPESNAGLMLQSSDTTRIGLTYHSALKYKLKGHTQVDKGTNVPAALSAHRAFRAEIARSSASAPATMCHRT